MSFQDVLDGLVRVYAEHLAKIWIQGEVPWMPVEEVKHSGILLLQNDIEGILVFENLLVKLEECIEKVLVMACALPFEERLQFLNQRFCIYDMFWSLFDHFYE